MPPYIHRYSAKQLEQMFACTGLRYLWSNKNLVFITPLLAATHEVAAVAVENFLPSLNYSDDRIEEIEVIGISSSLRHNLA